MAEQNIFPVHEVQNLLGYGQLEFLKPNKKNIFMRYTMKNKGIKHIPYKMAVIKKIK